MCSSRRIRAAREYAAEHGVVPHKVNAVQSVILFVMAASLSGCDYPWWRFERMPIEVDFHSDDSCSITVDGDRISTADYKQPFYDNSTSAGVASSALGAFTIECQDSRPWTPGLRPSVTIILTGAVGVEPAPGRYAVYEFSSSLNRIGANVMVLDAHLVGDGWLHHLRNGLTGAYLEVFDGDLTIEKVIRAPSPRPGGDAGPLLITGRLAAYARRSAAPLIE